MHKTGFFEISIALKTKLRFLLRLVASATIIVASASPKKRKSLVTSSSCEQGVKEYVPGRSTKINFSFLWKNTP